MKKLVKKSKQIFPKSKRFKSSTRKYGFPREQRVLSKKDKKIRKVSKKVIRLKYVQDKLGRFQGSVRAR